MCGLEMVPLRKGQEAKLEVAEMKILRFPLGMTRMDKISTSEGQLRLSGLKTAVKGDMRRGGDGIYWTKDVVDDAASQEKIKDSWI